MCMFAMSSKSLYNIILSSACSMVWILGLSVSLSVFHID